MGPSDPWVIRGGTVLSRTWDTVIVLELLGGHVNLQPQPCPWARVCGKLLMASPLPSASFPFQPASPLGLIISGPGHEDRLLMLSRGLRLLWDLPPGGSSGTVTSWPWWPGDTVCSGPPCAPRRPPTIPKQRVRTCLLLHQCFWPQAALLLGSVLPRPSLGAGLRAYSCVLGVMSLVDLSLPGLVPPGPLTALYSVATL